MKKIAFFITLPLVALLALSSACRAQFPQGPPIPLSGVQADEMHMMSRFGYEGNSGLYKYHGEVEEDGNFVSLGGSSVYGFADLAVGCGIKPGNILQPDRLWGTFEVGYRRKCDESRLVELFYRHQSAHCVDRDDWPESMWEMTGIRLRQESGRAQLGGSIGYYDRRIYLDYDMDAQAFVSYHFAGSEGREAFLDLDVHGVTEHKAFGPGYVDYSIEPKLQLTRRLGIFGVYGLEHDVNKPDGETDQPLVIGFYSQI